MNYNSNDKQSNRGLQFSSGSKGEPADYQETGIIGQSDFFIWTLIASSGIIFCFIHTEQERLWTWTGETVEEAQSLEAKIVVSIISTLIGSCVIALLMKTIVCISYTLIKYRGAHFSQLVAVIGGHLPSHIPMLISGRGWFSIIIIIFVLIASVVTKQLAVVSMGVAWSSSNGTESFYTRNYTSCTVISDSSSVQRVLPVLCLDAINSIRNPNVSYTNEFFDRSIPAGLKGTASFYRELPFADVSCKVLPGVHEHSQIYPSFTRSYDPDQNTTGWQSFMNVSLTGDSDNDEAIEWVDCSISIGHATARTSCKDTLCHTDRVSGITPYGYIRNSVLTNMLELIFEMVQPSASSGRNIMLTWLLGGEITKFYSIMDGPIPGESIDVIERRIEQLATISGRILCDLNGGRTEIDVTTFESNYEINGRYVYHVLWKWPFWLLVGWILLCWCLCLVLMWITPESRVLSVDWLLNQYIERDRWSYLSGRDLVKTHAGSVFQVVDLYPDNDSGMIAISKKEVHSVTKADRILNKRLYI
ncbi:hypothetical protein BD770DRAFT_394806 [Pilaira anomala]|nr:hypothetical protein BD770DRAFT_394806 [Pilaira anomala]